jgi:hypothetical protein
VNQSSFDIRLSNAEAIVLLELARRLRDEPALSDQLNPAEQVVVTNLTEVLAGALHATGAV